LVRGVPCPGPQQLIQQRQGSGAHMFRVQNQAKQAVSSGLPLAVVEARGDLPVAMSPDQNKIHSTPDRVQVPQGSLSLTGMHKLR
jgi:hypothetical protein